MRTIDVRGRKMLGSGIHSTYYRLSARRGVKVYGAADEYNGAVYTKDELNFSEVRRDFNLIREIKCPITPNAYEVVAVRGEHGWYPGLIMEHCEGVEVWSKFQKRSPLYWKRVEDVVVKMGYKFEKTTGYVHEDLHGGNIIYNKKTKRYKVIDITVDFTSVSRREAA